MPIYEYKCECGEEVEAYLRLDESQQPQICKCGDIMQRKMSVPCPAIFTPTGRGMALDSLNSKDNGMPNRHWKAPAKKAAASGLAA